VADYKRALGAVLRQWSLPLVAGQEATGAVPERPHPISARFQRKGKLGRLNFAATRLSVSGLILFCADAEVAKWQTQRTQNPPSLRTCGFKSRPRHQKTSQKIRPFRLNGRRNFAGFLSPLPQICHNFFREIVAMATIRNRGGSWIVKVSEASGTRTYSFNSAAKAKAFVEQRAGASQPTVRGGMWEAQVRRKGFYDSATFESRKQAEDWARAKETEMVTGRFMPRRRPPR
jgi:hypothetical protein